MPDKVELRFLKNFEATLKLLKANKIKGVQLLLGEKPGQTVANVSGDSK